MNLPDPSGSSAPEPPGIKSTFALESAAANSLTERFRWSAVRLFDKNLSLTACFSTALAVSYSQAENRIQNPLNLASPQSCLVPHRFGSVYHLRKCSSEVLMLQLYTGSSLPSYRAFSARSLTRPFLLPIDSRENRTPRSFMSAVKSIFC